MNGYKVINDSVHGHMEFHPLCIKVIDTPEFQRLRNIKQLGLTYLVYPSAAHSRFEHSLGVCHLAGKMIDELKKNNKTNITDEEKLCVQIAGLCHDLGHGPFSHLWEEFVERRMDKEWNHEEQSIKMFDHLLMKNHLIDDFEGYGLGEKEREFIKALITGNPLNQRKQYLFQVVNNKINDIDVDKWDYYLRDGLHLNLKLSFDYERMMKFIMVKPLPAEDNKEVLVFKEKEAYSIYEMFNVRAKIHLAAAQHRVALVLDRMLLDALCEADDHFMEGSKLSQAHDDLDIWTKLTDNILFDILNRDLISREGAELLKTSQLILDNLLKRRLYKFITFKEVSSVISKSDSTRFPRDLERELSKTFSEFELVVSCCWFNLTSMDGDPFTNVYFYDKRNPNQLVRKNWNEIELFRSAEDPAPRPHCKVYIFSKNLEISKNDADYIKSYFQNMDIRNIFSN